MIISIPFEQNTPTSRLLILNWSVRWSYQSYLAMKWSNCVIQSCHASNSSRSCAIGAPIWRCFSTYTTSTRTSSGASCRASRMLAVRWNCPAGAYSFLSPGLDIMTTILVFLTFVCCFRLLCVCASVWLRCGCVCGMSSSSSSSFPSPSNRY